MEKVSKHERVDGKDGTTKDPPSATIWNAQKIILFVSMAYANFCLSACSALPAPFYPHEAEKKGASPAVYGLVFGAFQLTNAIMSPVCGKLIRVITPRFMVIAGMFIAGCCSILFGFLDKCPPGMSFIVLSFCVRIIESVGATAYLTAAYGVIPVVFPGNAGKSVSTMDTFYGLGLIFGASAGGFLYQAGGYSLPFTTMGALLLTGTLLTFVIFPKDLNELPSAAATSITAIISNAEFLLDLVVYFTCFMAIGFNQATLEPHLRQFHLEPYILGIVFVVSALTFSLSSPIWGHLTDKGINGQILSAAGCISCLFCYLLIGPAPFLYFKTSLYVVIFSQMMLGVGLGLQLVGSYVHGMQNVVGRGFPDNVSTYALLCAIMSVVGGLGAFVGPSIGGFLLEYTGYKMATLFMFLIELLVMIIIIVYKVRRKYSKNFPDIEMKQLL